ncbi:hypothetical protein B566_EDAN015247 [Ephemera danica]|nr:hypothetical protein B566_EDAN015247 [Ephemera danica]
MLVGKQQLFEWSHRITQLFKKEEQNLYYFPSAYRTNDQGRKVRQQSGGKIFHRLAYLRRVARTEGFDSNSEGETSDNEASTASVDQSNPVQDDSSTSNTDQSVVVSEEKLRFLQAHVEPKDRIIACWEETHKIAADFKILYSEKVNNFLTSWADISAAICALASVQKPTAFDTYEGCQSELAALFLLPYLFEPVNIKKKATQTQPPAPPETQGRKGKGTNYVRPTRKDAQKRLVLHVPVQSAVKSEIDTLKKLNQDIGLTTQPLIVIVGDLNAPTARYVAINDIFYSFDNILSAADTCFKSFFAFQALYPIHVEREWLLIQKLVYDITTVYDAKIRIERIQSVMRDISNKLQEIRASR